MKSSLSFNTFVLFDNFLQDDLYHENIIRIRFLQNEENPVTQERTSSICTEFSLGIPNISNSRDGPNTLET